MLIEGLGEGRVGRRDVRAVLVNTLNYSRSFVDILVNKFVFLNYWLPGPRNWLKSHGYRIFGRIRDLALNSTAERRNDRISIRKQIADWIRCYAIARLAAYMDNGSKLKN